MSSASSSNLDPPVKDPQSIQDFMGRIQALFSKSAPEMSNEQKIALSKIQMAIMDSMTKQAEILRKAAIFNIQADKDAFGQYLLHSKSGQPKMDLFNKKIPKRNGQKGKTKKGKNESRPLDTYRVLLSSIAEAEMKMEDKKELRMHYQFELKENKTLRDIGAEIQETRFKLEQLHIQHKISMFTMDLTALKLNKKEGSSKNDD